tara:strand:- start:1264 stop:1929 length:666 start_codon:yes stop_codon:yes gene_type:complete
MFSKEDFESELESHLIEFYHNKIVPLEKEIVRLGGELHLEENQNIVNFGYHRFVPMNPFKEKREEMFFWEDKNSDYYKFFKSLFKECLKKEWITIKFGIYDYEKTFINWMWTFGCIDIRKRNPENIIMNADIRKFVPPLEWYGQKNLCVYLIDYLDKMGFISSRRPNEVIKMLFLPNSNISTIANTKSKFRFNKKDKIFEKKPLKSSEIDDLISELIARLD